MLTSSRLALLVAYDGTPYRGWTDVRDSVLRPTLQRVLRSADDELPLIEAASRTDAGVHAFGQVCSLSLASRKEELDTGQLRYSLNQLLPPEVVVRGCKVMDADFDVRANVAKSYIYKFSTAACRDPLSRLREWHVPPRRGRPAWNEAAAAAFAEQLRGTHSFAAYGNTPRGKERLTTIDPVCSLSEISLARVRYHHEPDDSDAPSGCDSARWCVTVRGDRFLYKMVRNLVGALVRVGSGELTADECLEALERGSFRRSASVPLTAPAHGLTLQRVEYALDPFSR